MNQTTLHDLYSRHGQSPWLDNLRRGWITSGQLADWIDRGVRGLTSNPTIFQQAIESSPDYDEQFNGVIAGGGTVAEAYWELVTTDVAGALEAFAPTYAATDAQDGFVSLEVDPNLAHDPAGTATAALGLHKQLAARNLMVKIPGTQAGLGAITEVVAAGYSVNVTLIFSVDRYEQVAEAYLSGLEACDRDDLSGVASVASFFVSRIDTDVDRQLAEIGTAEATGLAGQLAIANARVAYGRFKELHSGGRWEALAARGARPQRLLWASTSAKNPAYSPTLYVDELVGPDSVNTMPDATLEAFMSSGCGTRTLDADGALDAAHATLGRLGEVGVDLSAVCDRLEAEGVASFTKSFEGLLSSLQAKASEGR